MIFTINQIEEILKILDFHHSFVIATNLGVDVLIDKDRDLLSDFGVNLDVLNKDLPLFDKIYAFGKLASILSDNQTASLNYDDFAKYLKTGQYIPLTPRELVELDLAKRKTYTHLKGLRERAKVDAEGIILSEERARQQYEDTIKTEIERGVADRRSTASIVSEIAHKMDNWKHDWGRIVETESQNLYNASRAQIYAEKFGPDVLVYKTVYPQACRHCIRLYTTSGIGSEPIVKKLSEVVKNGDNIGKKVTDWKFIVGATHPYCRCDLKYVPEGYKWNSETRSFELPKDWVRKVERKSKIKITVGDKSFEV